MYLQPSNNYHDTCNVGESSNFEITNSYATINHVLSDNQPLNYSQIVNNLKSVEENLTFSNSDITAPYSFYNLSSNNDVTEKHYFDHYAVDMEIVEEVILNDLLGNTTINSSDTSTSFSENNYKSVEYSLDSHNVDLDMVEEVVLKDLLENTTINNSDTSTIFSENNYKSEEYSLDSSTTDLDMVEEVVLKDLLENTISNNSGTSLTYFSENNDRSKEYSFYASTVDLEMVEEVILSDLLESMPNKGPSNSSPVCYLGESNNNSNSSVQSLYGSDIDMDMVEEVILNDLLADMMHKCSPEPPFYGLDSAHAPIGTNRTDQYPLDIPEVHMEIVEEVISNDLLEDMLHNNSGSSTAHFSDNYNDIPLKSSLDDVITTSNEPKLSITGTLHRTTSSDRTTTVVKNDNSTFSLQAPTFLITEQRSAEIKDTKDLEEIISNKCYFEKKPVMKSNPYLSENKVNTKKKYPSKNRKCHSKILSKHVLPDGIKLASCSYKYVDIYSTELTTSIYENAIKKIDIYEKEILRDTILMELGYEIKIKNSYKSRVNTNIIYSKVMKYILDKISPHINNVVRIADILITPGMSITDIKDRYISNKIFFDRLSEHIKEIEKDIEKAHYEEFLPIIQGRIYFTNSKYIDINTEEVDISILEKIAALLKNLIIGYTNNLSKNIKLTIKNFDSHNILSSIFIEIHGAYISKSFIRNVVDIFAYDELMMKKEHLGITDQDVKKKLKKLFKKYCVLHEGKVLSPNKSTVNLISNHLLLDINYGPNLNTDSVFPITQDTLTNKKIPTSYKSSRLYGKDKKKFKQSNYKNKHCGEISATNQDKSMPENSVMPKGLKIVSNIYTYNNMHYMEFSKNTYEYIIGKIDIDKEKLLRSKVLELLKNRIKNRGFNASLMDISHTYSRMKKYISDKVHPLIDYILRIKDIRITPGMSISDIKNNCISNEYFFDTLHKCCKEIAKNLSEIKGKNFLPMLQRTINFGSEKNLFTSTDNIDTSTRIKINSLFKTLIIDALNNLSDSIKSIIEKFNEDHISECMFIKLYGAYVPGSLIRNVKDIYIIDKMMVENKFNVIDKPLIKIKLEEIVKESVILYGGVVLSPNESTVTSMVDYLLSDIVKGHSDIRSKLFVENETLKSNYKKTSVNEASQDYRDPLVLRKHIYESAIEEIRIDEDRIFVNCILKELKDDIESNDFDKSCINLSMIYSNIRKYISDKVHSLINSTILISDILIDPGMSITEIKRKSISNALFFYKLYEQCKDLAIDINEIPHESFLPILSSNDTPVINVGNVAHNKRDKILQELRCLIVDTIYNLPQKIIFVIDKLKATDISRLIFIPFNDVYVTKSFMRNALDICNGSYDFKIKKPRSIDNFHEKKRLEEMMKKSVILIGEMVFSPSESTIKSIIGHLLKEFCQT